MTVQYIDGVPVIDAGGQIRKLAALPPPATLKMSAARYGDAFGAIDKSTWKPFDFADVVRLLIRNQKQYGSCTGYAGVGCLDLMRRLEGQSEVTLSCTFPYAQVNNNVDQGASVTSVLKVMMTLGTCTEAECSVDQIYKQQIPPAAYETAKKYLVKEAFLCRSYDELLDAINRGFPVALGILVGNNFSRLNSEGIAPTPITTIGGHALMGIGIKPYGNDWIIKVQNSWGIQWGMNGCCYLTRQHFNYVMDGYAVQYVKNLNPPPPVPQASEPVEVIRAQVPEGLTVTMESGVDLSKETVVEKKSKEDCIRDLMAEQDKKLWDKITAPVDGLDRAIPGPDKPVRITEEGEVAPPAPETETIPPELVEPVTEENSLLAQFQEEDPKPVEGTASTVHTDPESLTGSRRDKKRHKH